MAQHYLKRGYPQDLMTQSRDKAFAVLHHDLIHKSVKKTALESRTPLVITYNKTNQDLMGLVHKYWPILQSTTRGAILLKNLPVRAYSWSENLRDILVRATLKPLNTQQTKHTQQPCTHQDCQTCKLLKRRKVLPTKNRDMKLAQNVDCNTNNVVYLLECNKHYVGETKRKFIIRFKEHLADIRHNRDTPVAKHHNLNSHKNNTTPVFPLPTSLSRITGHPDRTKDVQKNKEKMWIYTLRSIAPHGINLRE